MAEWFFFYDSRYMDDTVREILEIARSMSHIKIIDTANMSDEEHNKIYFDIIVPISVFARIKVRGHIRTHKAGAIWFSEGVLVKSESDPREGRIWIGREALDVLRKLRHTA